MTTDEIIEAISRIVSIVEETQTHRTVPEILYHWDLNRRRIDRIQANPVDYRHETMAGKEYINWGQPNLRKFEVTFLTKNPFSVIKVADEKEAAVEYAKHEFQKVVGYWPSCPYVVKEVQKKSNL